MKKIFLAVAFLPFIFSYEANAFTQCDSKTRCGSGERCCKCNSGSECSSCGGEGSIWMLGGGYYCLGEGSTCCLTYPGPPTTIKQTPISKNKKDTKKSK